MAHKNLRSALTCLTLIIATHSSHLFAQGQDDLFNPKIEINILEQEEKKSPDWKGFLEGYLPALGIASCVGAATGLICAWLENKRIVPNIRMLGIPIPISWLFLWGTRDVAIHLIAKDMTKHNIPHNKRLCYMTARLTDWMVYLLLKRNYYGSLVL